MIHRQYLAGQLALIAWREAHHYGGHRPMIMVAQTIANRFKKHWGTWEWLFDNHTRFSAKNADEQKNTGWPIFVDVNWGRLLSEIDGVVEGTSPDPTNPERKPEGGAVYWADLNDITNPWFKQEVLGKPEHLRVANNGTLTFWT